MNQERAMRASYGTMAIRNWFFPRTRHLGVEQKAALLIAITLTGMRAADVLTVLRDASERDQ